MKFRNVQENIYQGLKMLFYGIDNSGKSLTSLTFPKIADVDTESKLGVYERNPKYNKNIIGIANTVNYYETIELIRDILTNPNKYETLVIDSETNLYDDMQVSAMECEESRATKQKKAIDDAIVAQRGWGKVKLNNARLRNLKAQASAKGITVISVAHKKDITQEVNGKSIKIGEKPDLKEGSRHDYDVIVRFFIEKDIVSGEFKYLAEIEKDTTCTYKTGTRIENMTYEHWKHYIENSRTGVRMETNYDKSLEDNLTVMQQESQSFDDLSKEFVDRFKELKSKDEKNGALVTQLLKDNGVESYKNPEFIDGLKKVVEIMRGM